MKIAIIGYGKMGQEIEKLAIKRGHEIPLIIDNWTIGNPTETTSPKWM